MKEFINVMEVIWGNVRNHAWTDFHPPPKEVNEYSRAYRKAQRAALECQRGSPEVRNALYDSI